MGSKLKVQLQNRLLEFLKTGNLFADIRQGDDIEKLTLLPEKPLEVIGNEEWGFFNHYSNGLRIAHSENKIVGIAILFSGYYSGRTSFYLDILELGNKIKISAKTKVTEMVTALNYNNITWLSHKEKSLSVFCMLTMGEVYIVYDLDTGELDRITI